MCQLNLGDLFAQKAGTRLENGYCILVESHLVLNSLHWYIPGFISCIFIYRKDTEPFISCFHVLTSTTSFQYISIHTMSFIALYNYMLSRYLKVSRRVISGNPVTLSSSKDAMSGKRKSFPLSLL